VRNRGRREDEGRRREQRQRERGGEEKRRDGRNPSTRNTSQLSQRRGAPEEGEEKKETGVGRRKGDHGPPERVS